jgi:hypothetical protein
MSVQSASGLCCSQCARPLPADPEECAEWVNVDAVRANRHDGDVLTILLCPECRTDDREHEFEEGGGD